MWRGVTGRSRRPRRISRSEGSTRQTEAPPTMDDFTGDSPAHVPIIPVRQNNGRLSDGSSASTQLGLGLRVTTRASGLFAAIYALSPRQPRSSRCRIGQESATLAALAGCPANGLLQYACVSQQRLITSNDFFILRFTSRASAANVMIRQSSGAEGASSRVLVVFARLTLPIEQNHAP